MRLYVQALIIYVGAPHLSKYQAVLGRICLWPMATALVCVAGQ